MVPPGLFRGRGGCRRRTGLQRVDGVLAAAQGRHVGRVDLQRDGIVGQGQLVFPTPGMDDRPLVAIGGGVPRIEQDSLVQVGQGILMPAEGRVNRAAQE